MKMLCPMHQTMVTAPAMVSHRDRASCKQFMTRHRRCCEFHEGCTQPDHAKQVKLRLTMYKAAATETILTQAGIICFLLSPAAMDVNGTTLPVDQVVDQLRWRLVGCC
jgi:hypothetical protein